MPINTLHPTSFSWLILTAPNHGSPETSSPDASLWSLIMLMVAYSSLLVAWVQSVTTSPSIFFPLCSFLFFRLLRNGSRFLRRKFSLCSISRVLGKISFLHGSWNPCDPCNIILYILRDRNPASTHLEMNSIRDFPGPSKLEHVFSLISLYFVSVLGQEGGLRSRLTLSQNPPFHVLWQFLRLREQSFPTYTRPHVNSSSWSCGGSADYNFFQLVLILRIWLDVLLSLINNDTIIK